MAQMITCPYCGKLTNPKLDACPNCGGPMQQRVPPPQLAPRRPEGRGAQTCPNCHALVQDGDIICVACGTNLLTGQKIAGSGKPAAQGLGFRFPWLVMASVLGVAAVLLLVIGVAYLLTRDPVQQAAQLAAANKEIEAATLLTKHLAKHANDPAALALMGKLEWKRGRFQEAAENFTKGSDASQKDADLAMMAVLALASQNGGDTREQRVKYLKRVVDDAPDNMGAQYLLAIEQGAAGDLDGEIKALKAIVDKTPNDAQAALGLGVAQALKGEMDDARKLLETTAQNPAMASEASAALGFAAGLSKNPDAAVEALKTSVAGNTTVKNQALTRLGTLLIAQGKLEEAQPFLAEAVTENKDNIRAQFFHGVCLQARGLTPEAINAFESAAVKQGALAAEALVRVAELHLVQGDAQKARESIEKAEAAGVSTAALSTIRGRMHAAIGEDDKARESFAKAIKTDANYAPAHLENALLNIRQQSVAEGIQELEKYLALVDPNQQGTRAAEVEAVLNHLKQAAGKPAPPAGASENRSAQS